MALGRRKSTPRWHKAVALLPLVALSGAWSANAASHPAAEPVAQSGQQDGPLSGPGGPAVPDDIFDQPASVALPDGFSAPTGGLAPVGGTLITSSNSASRPAGSGSVAPNGIPTAALTAYQRAADILNSADAACNIDWTLIAAIGRVESDHGRFGGNALDEQGKARPGIYGPPLDGSNGTARIADTDGGRLDRDPVHDRAVGPMQFIPGTWAVAGVDADQDGVKDPQDVDDAATASAVYLCAGDGDLSTGDGRRTAVYRYNHSYEYVDSVLAIAAAYAGGNYAPVPNGTASTTTLTPLSPAQQAGKAEAQRAARRGSDGGNGGDGDRAGDGVAVTGGGDTASDDRGSAGGSNGSDGNSSSSPERDNQGDDGADDGDRRDETPTPTPRPTRSPAPEPSEAVEKAEKTAKETVQTLGLGEATALCDDKLGGALTRELVDSCSEELEGKTRAQADHLLRGTVADVIARL